MFLGAKGKGKGISQQQQQPMQNIRVRGHGQQQQMQQQNLACPIAQHNQRAMQAAAGKGNNGNNGYVNGARNQPPRNMSSTPWGARGNQQLPQQRVGRPSAVNSNGFPKRNNVNEQQMGQQQMQRNMGQQRNMHQRNMKGDGKGAGGFAGLANNNSHQQRRNNQHNNQHNNNPQHQRRNHNNNNRLSAPHNQLQRGSVVSQHSDGPTPEQRAAFLASSNSPMQQHAMQPTSQWVGQQMLQTQPMQTQQMQQQPQIMMQQQFAADYNGYQNVTCVQTPMGPMVVHHPHHSRTEVGGAVVRSTSPPHQQQAHHHQQSY